MLTCYIFVNEKNKDELLSIRLNLSGDIEQVLKMRTLEEIRELQFNCKTVIVMPTQWSTLLELELPWLAERKAREAIPFALEDHLAQSVNQLHFSIDRAHYKDNSYLVVVMAKLLLQEWMMYFQSMNIGYDAITIDWFALVENEGIILDDRVLINAGQYKGTLSFDVWASYTQDWCTTLQWQAFTDSVYVANITSFKENKQISYEWLAKRLHQHTIMNLCQGEFQHDTSRTQVSRWYQWTGIVAGVWLFCFFAIHAGLWMMVSHKNKQLDQQIFNAYHVFFPDARQVISPKIRIMQLLKKGTQHDAVLWSLMEKLSQAFAKNKHNTTKVGDIHHLEHVTLIQDLQFQNQVLTITLLCESFVALEKMEADLRQAQVRVHQVSAATDVQEVVAKLELSL